MYTERRITLKDNIYYVRILQEYKKNSYGYINLTTKNWKDDYYDGGDLSILIEKIEKNYTREKSKEYHNDIYIGDILYIYDRIPFLSGIKEVYISKDNVVAEENYIPKEEIDKIIKEFNIKMHNSDNFKLYDERTWYI